MSNPTNATLGAITTHTYTITDDDLPPTVTLSLMEAQWPKQAAAPP